MLGIYLFLRFIYYIWNCSNNVEYHFHFIISFIILEFRIRKRIFMTVNKIKKNQPHFVFCTRENWEQKQYSMSCILFYENTVILYLGIYEVLIHCGNSTLLLIFKPNLDYHRDDVIGEICWAKYHIYIQSLICFILYIQIAKIIRVTELSNNCCLQLQE